MDGYVVAHVDEIEEIDDGRAPMRAVRHHFGITSFGVNAWIAREAGARIINEHDESEPDSQEELYLVLRGRASFELDGEALARLTGAGVGVEELPPLRVVEAWRVEAPAAEAFGRPWAG
jgi:hypothetical protein